MSNIVRIFKSNQQFSDDNVLTTIPTPCTAGQVLSLLSGALALRKYVPFDITPTTTTTTNDNHLQTDKQNGKKEKQQDESNKMVYIGDNNLEGGDYIVLYTPVPSVNISSPRLSWFICLLNTSVQCTWAAINHSNIQHTFLCIPTKKQQGNGQGTARFTSELTTSHFLPPILYIRDCYDTFLSYIIEAQTYPCRYVLSSSAGMGKSVFLLYAARQLASSGWVVLYHRSSDNFQVLIECMDNNNNNNNNNEDKSTWLNCSEIREEEGKEKLMACIREGKKHIVLLDYHYDPKTALSSLHQFATHVFCVVSSTGEEYVRKTLSYKNVEARTLYLPTWSLDELLSIRCPDTDPIASQLFDSVTLQQWQQFDAVFDEAHRKKCYYRFGGNVHLVFQYPPQQNYEEKKQRQRRLASLISPALIERSSLFGNESGGFLHALSSLWPFKSNIQQDNENHDNLHSPLSNPYDAALLFALVPSQDYRSCTISFVSLRIMRLIWHTLYRKNSGEMLSHLRNPYTSTLKLGLLGPLMSIVYQMLGHMKLRHGGKFKVKRLDIASQLQKSNQEEMEYYAQQQINKLKEGYTPLVPRTKAHPFNAKLALQQKHIQENEGGIDTQCQRTLELKKAKEEIHILIQHTLFPLYAEFPPNPPVHYFSGVDFSSLHPSKGHPANLTWAIPQSPTFQVWCAILAPNNFFHFATSIGQSISSTAIRTALQFASTVSGTTMEKPGEEKQADQADKANEQKNENSTQTQAQTASNNEQTSSTSTSTDPTTTPPPPVSEKKEVSAKQVFTSIVDGLEEFGTHVHRAVFKGKPLITSTLSVDVERPRFFIIVPDAIYEEFTLSSKSLQQLPNQELHQHYEIYILALDIDADDCHEFELHPEDDNEYDEFEKNVMMDLCYPPPCVSTSLNQTIPYNTLRVGIEFLQNHYPKPAADFPRLDIQNSKALDLPANWQDTCTFLASTYHPSTVMSTPLLQVHALSSLQVERRDVSKCDGNAGYEAFLSLLPSPHTLTSTDLRLAVIDFIQHMPPSFQQTNATMAHAINTHATEIIDRVQCINTPYGWVSEYVLHILAYLFHVDVLLWKCVDSSSGSEDYLCAFAHISSVPCTSTVNDGDKDNGNSSGESTVTSTKYLHLEWVAETHFQLLTPKAHSS